MHQPLSDGVFLLLASLCWLTVCIAAQIAELFAVCFSRCAFRGVLFAALANSRQSVRQH